ncbi:hypothetical protein NGRA_2181 [Nosema granulosis]|uniref:Uncharacterized protein n=1 Tax=Nosema granulosis TaxID=83296 RepID=A0A9P6GXI0_9MICR|nr:hypothetical protein NGRA_2181 [Nosema granulosis]
MSIPCNDIKENPCSTLVLIRFQRDHIFSSFLFLLSRDYLTGDSYFDECDLTLYFIQHKNIRLVILRLDVCFYIRKPPYPNLNFVIDNDFLYGVWFLIFFEDFKL